MLKLTKKYVCIYTHTQIVLKKVYQNVNNCPLGGDSTFIISLEFYVFSAFTMNLIVSFIIVKEPITLLQVGKQRSFIEEIEKEWGRSRWNCGWIPGNFRDNFGIQTSRQPSRRGFYSGWGRMAIAGFTISPTLWNSACWVLPLKILGLQCTFHFALIQFSYHDYL